MLLDESIDTWNHKGKAGQFRVSHISREGEMSSLTTRSRQLLREDVGIKSIV